MQVYAYGWYCNGTTKQKSKVDNPYSVTFFYEDTCIGVVHDLVWLQKQIPKKHVFIRD